MRKASPARVYRLHLPELELRKVAQVASGSCNTLVRLPFTGSNPKQAQEKLLIPGSRDGITYNHVDYGVEVKVGDKVYTDSGRNGQCYRYNGCYVECELNSEFRKATFTVVWDKNIVNDKLEEGEIKVLVNGNVNQSKIVKKGEVVNFEVPVDKIDTLTIQFPKRNSQGLSIINGVLYR